MRKPSKDKPRSHETKKVFQLLDRCVHEARKAEGSGDWAIAYKEAERLRRLAIAARAGELVAYSTSVISDICQHDWVGMMVAVTAIISIGIAMYIHHQEHH